MRLSYHYLIAVPPRKSLTTEIAWNAQASVVPEALKTAILKIASWSPLALSEGRLFKGFAQSGRRSYIGVLQTPLETPVGLHSAVKLKAVGQTEDIGACPPQEISYTDAPDRVVVGSKGEQTMEPIFHEPLAGTRRSLAENGNALILTANQKSLPAPFALGVGAYPELSFAGEVMGINIVSVVDLETELNRIGTIFQIQNGSPEHYLATLPFRFGYEGGVREALGYMFHNAGEAQSQHNGGGVIPGGRHVGNFSVARGLAIILEDFDYGKLKKDLTPEQIVTLQLLDLFRFVYSAYILRTWSAGECLLQNHSPVSAYLEGYFGQEIFARHRETIGDPEKMLRSLDRPQATNDREWIRGAAEITKFSWMCLYDPLQEVLGQEGISYPLTPEQRRAKHMELFRVLFRRT
ncbi:hypothetical protein ACFL5U_03815 [Candidatus Margulisiibacteriota bacterium]